MAEIVCIGEALIDLVPTESGVGLAAAKTFVKAAGGAPANVAAGIARLGRASAFLGAVGDDGFGRFLVDTLAAAGVAVDGLRATNAAPTALAAVALTADGERDFVFYGTPAAHTLFSSADIDESMIRRAKILHFGSISLIGGPLRAATLYAIDIARRHGVTISYDPNLRLSLWPDADAARSGLRLGLSHAKIIKIAEEEVTFLTGADDPIEGVSSFWHPGLELVAVTRGANGSVWLIPGSQGEQAGFAVDTIDTTGAGDAFMAALLVGLLDDPGFVHDPVTLNRIVRFANAAGALATTKRGAIPALPDRMAVEQLLARRTEPS